MTFMTNDYLEYYLTLLGWIINNGIWNMISDTGLFAVPFAAIVMREWLKVRGEGADEGNKGVLSLARIETHEQATTYVFRRVQTRGRGPGVGPRLQPYRRLPFAGGGGFGLAPLGEAARGGAPGCDPEEQGVDA